MGFGACLVVGERRGRRWGGGRVVAAAVAAAGGAGRRGRTLHPPTPRRQALRPRCKMPVDAPCRTRPSGGAATVRDALAPVALSHRPAASRRTITGARGGDAGIFAKLQGGPCHPAYHNSCSRNLLGAGGQPTGLTARGRSGSADGRYRLVPPVNAALLGAAHRQIAGGLGLPYGGVQDETDCSPTLRGREVRRCFAKSSRSDGLKMSQPRPGRRFVTLSMDCARSPCSSP
jgi:hypothetical protein